VKLPSATYLHHIASQVNAHRVLLDELTGCNNRIIAPVKNVNECIYKVSLPLKLLRHIKSHIQNDDNRMQQNWLTSWNNHTIYHLCKSEVLS